MQALLKAVSVWYLKESYHKALKDIAGHIPSLQRTDRAYDILTKDSTYAIWRDPSAKVLTFHVHNTNEEIPYTVIPSKQSCTCADSERGNLCKHRIAIKIYIEAFRMQKEEKE